MRLFIPAVHLLVHPWSPRSQGFPREAASARTEAHLADHDIPLIAFITDAGPIRQILTHLGEPLEPPPVSPAWGPPTSWGELMQAHDERDVFQASPDELPVIDIHSV